VGGMRAMMMIGSEIVYFVVWVIRVQLVGGAFLRWG
jgi:hypothetical protein